MRMRLARLNALRLLGLALLALLAVGLARQFPVYGQPVLALGVVLLVLGASAALVWHADAALTLSLAVGLSIFSSNWQLIGLPGPLSPDRLLLVATIGMIIARAPQIRDRPPFRVEFVHWVLVIALAWAFCSALVAGTLHQRDALFLLLQRFGALPYLIFLLVPTIFQAERQRRSLVRVMTVTGFYLGVIALLQGVGANGAVWPRYIGQFASNGGGARAGGPFLDAVSNGAALFACGLVAFIGARGAASRAWRRFSYGVVVLDLVGCLLTLERSVWIAASAGALVAIVADRATRRFAVPLVLAVVVSIGLAFLVVPGLSAHASKRSQDKSTVWDRKNLLREGFGMIEAHPIAGVGWDRFVNEKGSYARQSATYPLTAGGKYILHNAFVSFGAELGLVGLSLWLLGAVLAVGGGVTGRAPPEFAPWRVALLSYAVFFAIIANFVYPQVFPILMLWVLAAVAWAGRLASSAAALPAVSGPGGQSMLAVDGRAI